ncbi:MAG: Phage capsid family protein [Syntrophorhabdus sp. PtaU1.Bin153]|nr:MAG: Phage capsid family protein [Syntrophorhabdus sp. PtaU1.Bin153]
MNKREMELRQDKASALKRMKDILDNAENSGRKLTPAEEKEYERLDKRVDEFNEEIRGFEQNTQRRANLSRQMTDLDKIVNPLPNGVRGFGNGGEPDSLGFRNLGEFFYSLANFRRDGKRDERLDRSLELREMTMGTGSQGGYAIPTQFDATVRQVSPQEAAIRPRATVIPPGDPPDAQLTFPVLDQTSGQNMYGGVVISHTGEGVTMNETTANLREGSLEPKEVSAYIVCTNKMLANWEAGSVFIQTILRQAVVGTEDFDFLRGDGINKALGVMNSGAAILHSRAGAGAISFADVHGMLARLLMRGPAVWVASQTIIPQLATMVDSGGHAVWLGGNGNQGAAAQAMPSTLFGIPLIFSDRLPGLGTKGDLMLLSPFYYLIKDGSGPIAASSEHIYFLSNKTVFKIVWNVDGRPWLTEPLPLEGSTSNTVSPFVVLN